ncbi:unnamed protein product, partial [Meganyctiphanes norvegica]
AEAEEELEAIDELTEEVDSLYEGLGLTRRRRRSESAIISIEYCPSANGNVSDTPAKLILKAIADIKTSISDGTILDVKDCFLDLIKTLKAMDITVSEEEKQELQAEMDEFERTVEAAVEVKTAAIEAKETELATKAAEVAELEQEV